LHAPCSACLKDTIGPIIGQLTHKLFLLHLLCPL
jgi:hypothetical protein